MEIINFFEKLFTKLGDLVGFMDTTITMPSLVQTFVNASQGKNVNGYVNVSMWSLLSTSLIVFLLTVLIFHIWHLVKLIG